MDTPGLREAYEASQWDLKGMSYEQFSLALRGTRVEPVMVDGKCCGALVIAGNELHACVQPHVRGRWLSRRVLRLLDAVIAQHGEAVTRVTSDAGRRFVEALGFEKDGELYRSRKQWVSHR
ncbi:hypothetical protein [Pseudoduganella chitinolytica]|uniref:N-acetyltransferase domain-containing protein n=1 Tax=Pseudoduganella chitinolytica TaxID=34070 RepID=A0ABY8BGQ9_9BURK|nr:hypothetical protein [Pseudoduganella chitinolytica]WEF34856.1 hypothetical protein PX653_08870 [Pseudoduganella chitinolytica]